MTNDVRQVVDMERLRADNELLRQQVEAYQANEHACEMKMIRGVAEAQERMTVAEGELERLRAMEIMGGIAADLVGRIAEMVGARPVFASDGLSQQELLTAVEELKERAEKAEADLAEARRETRQHVQQRITTRCPSCGHQSLFIGSGGHLTCSWLECKDPGLERAIEKLKASPPAPSGHPYGCQCGCTYGAPAPSGWQQRIAAMPTIFQSREVLADAYGHRLGQTNMLTHAVEVIDGRDTRVLCERVKLENVSDGSSGNDMTLLPTCGHCLRRLASELWPVAQQLHRDLLSERTRRVAAQEAVWQNAKDALPPSSSAWVPDPERPRTLIKTTPPEAAVRVTGLRGVAGAIRVAEDAAERLRGETALSPVSEASPVKPFTCAARRGKADLPQDCDWPFCGCDPHADKVIAHLQECEMLKSPNQGPPDIERAVARLTALRDTLRSTPVPGIEATLDGVIEDLNGAPRTGAQDPITAAVHALIEGGHEVAKEARDAVREARVRRGDASPAKAQPAPENWDDLCMIPEPKEPR